LNKEKNNFGGKMNALIINTGGSFDFKFYLVEDVSGICEKTIIKQSFNGSKEASYKEIAENLAPELLKKLKTMKAKIDVILFRTPAMNVNIKGLTFLTYNLVQNYGKYRAVFHGSEIGMFLSIFLSEKLTVPAIFGPGIPTDDLPGIVKMTGHPEIENEALSHYEACIGGVKLAVKDSDIPFFGNEGDVAIFLMLGSGIGVYLVWKNQQRWKLIHCAVRHAGGALSDKSCGDLPVLPFINWFVNNHDLSFLSGREALEKLQNECKSLSGKSGLGLWRKKWTDFITFMGDVKDKSSEDHKLAVILYNKIIYGLVTNIGEARMAANVLTGTLPDQKVQVLAFGGVANDHDVIEDITKYTRSSILSSVVVVKGDPELEFYLDLLKQYENNSDVVVDFDSLTGSYLIN